MTLRNIQIDAFEPQTTIRVYVSLCFVECPLRHSIKRVQRITSMMPTLSALLTGWTQMNEIWINNIICNRAVYIHTYIPKSEILHPCAPENVQPTIIFYATIIMSDTKQIWVFCSLLIDQQIIIYIFHSVILPRTRFILLLYCALLWVLRVGGVRVSAYTV